MPDRSNDEDAAVALFVGVLNLSRLEATAIAAFGFTSLEELAYVPEDELLQIKGLSAAQIIAVRERARTCLLAGF